MDGSLSDEDFQADKMINRSCNQKIQDDSLQSDRLQTIKFKATRSQNELNNLEGETAMDVLSQQWKRNEKNKQKKEKNRVQINRNSNRNSPTHRRNPQFFQVGTDLVNSEEISIDEDFLRSEDHIERSQHSRRHNNQQMKIIEERRKKEMQQLITLNILTLGKSGVGKSSFIECFSNKNYENSPIIRSKTEIMNIVTVRNESDNFQIKLIDMPGYEETKVQQYLKDVENLINKRFQAHINKISDRKALRSEIKDERIHCCLYFLSGPWICESDWVIMKKIENITNIIPIVAKGDTFTTRQIKEFKKKILERNKTMNVNWFSIEEYLRSYHPEKLKPLNEGTFGRSPPFVITCCTEKQYNQTTKKHEMVRDFRWGKCQLNNESHNDYKFLKSLLLYYLSDLLIKTTDLTMRGFQQRMIENRLRIEQSRGGQDLRGDEPLPSSISQSQELLKGERQFIEIIKTYVPVGLTLAALIGVYLWMKRKQ